MSARRSMQWFLLAAALLAWGGWCFLPGCSRSRPTSPEEDVKHSGGAKTTGSIETTASAGSAASVTGEQGWGRAGKVDRQKDCDAEPLARYTSATSGYVIRYLWQDCNGDGTEDRAGDTYTADYYDDGVTDRRVVYRENEMSVDYYSTAGGDVPVYSWFICDDRWHLTDFSYTQSLDQWSSEHHRGFFSLQKLSRLNNQWYPFSESPFCFYDTDGDGVSEVALRVCSLYSPEQDANDYSLIWKPLRERPVPLFCGFRLSFDLENDATLSQPYSYSISFTVELLDPIDEGPYLRPFVTSYGRKFSVIPKDTALELAFRVITGQIGVRKRIGFTHERISSRRWEGVIWHQDGKHNIHNAGGPSSRENRLQDFVDCTTEGIRLYTSEYDGLVHLFGADNSIFMEKGADAAYSDTDGDGYADTVESHGSVDHIGREFLTDLSIEELFGNFGFRFERR